MVDIKTSKPVVCDVCGSNKTVKVKNKSEFIRDDFDQYTCLKCGGATLVPKIATNIKLYHWTAKHRKYRIKQFGLKTRICLYSPTGKGIYASDVPDKWEPAMKYENDSDVICFSFISTDLKIMKHGDDYIVIENIPASLLTFEENLSCQRR